MTHSIVSHDRFEKYGTHAPDTNLYLQAQLLAPVLDAEATKNNASVVVNFGFREYVYQIDTVNFLTGGDAEVEVWEELFRRYHDSSASLQYNLLQCPHHCSWHSLSYDSWSELRHDAEVSATARWALSRTLPGALVVASSSAIQDDDNDPPCYGAMLQYQQIVSGASGQFLCAGDRSDSEPLEFESTGRRFIQTTPRERSLLRRPVAAANGLGFPNRPLLPNKPGSFA